MSGTASQDRTTRHSITDFLYSLDNVFYVRMVLNGCLIRLT